MSRRIVHVIGTGTIGEPLIGLLCNFKGTPNHDSGVVPNLLFKSNYFKIYKFKLIIYKLFKY